MKYTIFTSMIFLILFIFGAMVMVSQVKAEDNKTIEFDDRGGRRYWMMMSGDHNWYSILSKPVIKEL